MNKWTKADIKEMVRMWEANTTTTQQIAKSLKRSHSNVMAMAKLLRNAGYPLKKKAPGKYLPDLIAQTIKELKGKPAKRRK